MIIGIRITNTPLWLRLTASRLRRIYRFLRGHCQICGQGLTVLPSWAPCRYWCWGCNKKVLPVGWYAVDVWEMQQRVDKQTAEIDQA